MVHPYVGFSIEYPRFIKQESEVKTILEIPLGHFLKSRNKSTTVIKVRDVVLNDTPYYDVNGHKIWGATAMMISELEHIVKDIF